MTRSGWPEDFAREAIFQLHGLSPHEDFFRSRRRSIGGRVESVRDLNLLFDVSCLVLRCSRDDARIAERRPKERAHGENVQNAADDRNA